MGKIGIQLRISGTVQGVFFRQSTQQKARELNICGWVRNTDDGCVELEAEGEEDALKEFTAWCQQGPARAIVRSAELKNIVCKNYPGFEIKR
jgi:acylphosphatase